MLGDSCGHYLGWVTLADICVLLSSSLFGFTYRYVEKLLTSGGSSSDILMHSSLPYSSLSSESPSKPFEGVLCS